MENNELLKHSKTWDRTGLIVSSLCIIHCIAFPIIVAIMPTIDALFGSTLFEVVLLTLAISVGGVSFITSYKRHRMIHPMLLGALGVTLLFISLYLDFSQSHNHPHSYTKSFWDNLDPYMILGGLLLVFSHFWNIHACHCFCDKSCDHQEHHAH